MQRKIILDGIQVTYTIQISTRAKRIRLAMRADTGLVVIIPARMPIHNAEQFIREKARWIIKTLNFFRTKKVILSPKERGASISKAQEQARVFITERVEDFSKRYNFSYNRIFIKSHKRRWGSCSAKKNLNFNYRLLFLPQKLADYIVVHELCHLKEMNHSKKFWQLVETIVPNHKNLQKELRKYIYTID
jgi:predicted metal-dependent hydrolase